MTDTPDLADIIGLDCAKRPLKIAAAGGHCLYISSEAGSGPVLLARCMPGLIAGLPANGAEVVATREKADRS